MDSDSYKFLNCFKKEDIELTVVIRLCLKNNDEIKNTFFIENLLNIIDVMI
jgi:hypothetical protein